MANAEGDVIVLLYRILCTDCFDIVKRFMTALVINCFHVLLLFRIICNSNNIISIFSTCHSKGGIAKYYIRLVMTRSLVMLPIYSISQEICTRFRCALLCCGMQSFIMNSHEVFIHIHQGCFAGTGAIVRLPQCQWSKPDGYGIISQCITTTKHSKAKTVCIFLGIYCS